MQSTPSAVAQSPGFLGLLTRFISGEISEQTWTHITTILDDAKLSPDEREAVACYLNEFLTNPHTSVRESWRRKQTAGEWGAPAHG